MAESVEDKKDKLIEDNLFRIDQMVRGLQRGAGMPEIGLSEQELMQGLQFARSQAGEAQQRVAQAGPQGQPRGGLV